jgi:periplasmic divalent cation tolerance protein
MAVVLVTVSSPEEADRITSVLLEARKAACVSRVPAVQSRFWWQGKIDSADEILLIIKTKTSAVPGIIELVKKNDSYSVPEVIALPIIAGNDDYLRWIDESVLE